MTTPHERDAQALALATAASRAQSANRHADAVELYRQALTIEPHWPEACVNLGTALQSLQRFDEALVAFESALRERPEFAEAENNRGNTLKSLGRLDEALAAFERAIELQPQFATAEFNRANTLQSLGQLEAAVNAFRRALELRPNYAKCANNLGNVLKSLGRLDEALAAYRQALRIEPHYANAEYNLATTLQAAGKLNEAIDAYHRALASDPQHAETIRNLGTALHALGRSTEAIENYRRVLTSDPHNPQAENNLGAALADLGRMSEAAAAYLRALQIKPDFIETHSNLGNVYKDTGRLDEAIACYHRALRLDPQFVAAHSNLVFCHQYRADATIERLNQVHADWNAAHSARYRVQWPTHDNVRDPERRLRIGLLSPDLGHHPIGYLLARILSALDREACEIYAYSNRVRKDELTARLGSHCAVWHDVAAWSDEELAHRIQADRVDIVLDLAGHTAGNRLLALARKPAPIQASWMGYVGPTGVEAIEYFIADSALVSDELVDRYEQRPIRLSGVSCCYELPLDAPAVGPLPALAKRPITFGSFNNPAKVTPQVVKTWAKILAQVPSSRLIMKFRGLGDPEAHVRYQSLFFDEGIEPSRIMLQGASPFREMLDQYQSHIDIALDPFPYNGGTTTMLALWMGVPVVTCPGETVAARQSWAVLRALELPELAATDLDDYVRRAVALANDLPRLAELRGSLRERFLESPLTDGARVARDWLAALRQVWRQWCQQPANRTGSGER